MLFKNFIKLSFALFLATPSLAADFQGDCAELNKELLANVKQNIEESEKAESYPPLKECSVNEKGEIVEMYLISRKIDKNSIEKALSHKKVKKLTYLLDNDFYQEEPAVYNNFPIAINKLPELEELTIEYYEEVFDHGYYNLEEHGIDANIFNLESKKIKTINLSHIEIDEDVIKQLGKLESLENLIVNSGYIRRTTTSNERNYNLLSKLKNIDNIILDDKIVNVHHKYSGECQKMDDYLWPNALENAQQNDDKNVLIPLRECVLNSKGEVTELYFVNVRNDKELIEKALSHNSIKKLTYKLDNTLIQNEEATYNDFPTIISQISNLEELTLKYSHEVVESDDTYNDEKELNPDVLKTSSIKILTLDHIKITDELVKQIDKISSLEQLIVISGDDGTDTSVSSKDEVKLENLITNPNMEIFVDDLRVHIVTNNELPISTNGRCGTNDGVCPSGKCCSKYGYCGKSDDHCGKGCQSEFGECKTTTTTTSTKKPLPTSTNDRCGKDDGVCPSGKCCSKYGYCGKSDDHCGKGCQSEFGKCKTTTTTTKTKTKTTTKKALPTSTNGKCGKNDGVCPSGKCCSKYGYCGKSDDHCGKGCQSEFGKCN